MKSDSKDSKETVKINGIAHIILSVTDVKESKKLYAPLLQYMGLSKMLDKEHMLYYVGGRTAIGIQQRNLQANESYEVTKTKEYKGENKFSQENIGLHHFCIRAYDRESVDKIAKKVEELGGKIATPPQEGEWAPGYYYFIFEDRDGIRIEVNHVPGGGLFDTKDKHMFAKL